MGRIGRALGRPVVGAGRRLGDEGWSRGAKGSGIWLAVGILTGGIRVLRRLGTRKREVLYSRELTAGETLRLSHLLEDRKGRPVKP